jgi:hypothetical protein
MGAGHGRVHVAARHTFDQADHGAAASRDARTGRDAGQRAGCPMNGQTNESNGYASMQPATPTCPTDPSGLPEAVRPALAVALGLAEPYAGTGAERVFPAFGVVADLVRHRRLDAIGALVLAGIPVGAVLGLVNGDTRLLLAEGSVPTAVFGLVCLGSLWTRRPWIFRLAHEFIGVDTPPGASSPPAGATRDSAMPSGSSRRSVASPTWQKQRPESSSLTRPRPR